MCKGKPQIPCGVSEWERRKGLAYVSEIRKVILTTLGACATKGAANGDLIPSPTRY